jgi:hypothetical protein
VTGGALNADGRVLALRTYTDAWLYPVPDGDVVAALRGTPVRVPLPGEPQGEAVAFTADGTLLSGSESRGDAVGEIRAVPGAVALAGSAPVVPSPAATSAATPPATTAAPATAGAAPAGAPVAEAVSVWRAAAIGAGAVVVVLGLLAAAMARHTARRR